MTRTCDLDRRNCSREASFQVTITDSEPLPNTEALSFERLSCDRHLHWYKSTYGERGYELEIEEL